MIDIDWANLPVTARALWLRHSSGQISQGTDYFRLELKRVLAYSDIKLNATLTKKKVTRGNRM